jgi:hypothetical protein
MGAGMEVVWLTKAERERRAKRKCILVIENNSKTNERCED